MFGTTFADFYANGAVAGALAQLYELFGEGRNFTKGASARANQSMHAVKWSLTGGIGSNLRKAMEVAVPNLPAFNEQADWPELLMEQCKQLVNQIKGE